MEQKIIFQELPEALQDELRDAPISSIKDGKVFIDLISQYNNQPHHFELELKPRSLEDHSIIYITQDLQDVEVRYCVLRQSISA